MARSYWLEDECAPLPRHPLNGKPDVIVVGGGVTGCACALTLAQGGLRVRLHEAREVASGASGRNGGFALRGGAMPYDLARRTLGRERATDLWRLTERQLEELAGLAGGAFCRTGSLRLAADPEEARELRAEYEALEADGFACEWLDELAAPLATWFTAGLRHPPDGSLQPARWVRGLAQLAVEAGVEVLEHSRVGSLAELSADQVVLATDGYTRGLLPALDAAVSPARGQVLATAPLSRRLFNCPHYARRGYDYWQQTPDGRLVIGGWRDASAETESTDVEETTPQIQGLIERFAGELTGHRARVSHRWAGIFGVTADRLPLVGPVPGRTGLWVACGYSGHGNVLGLACGTLVGEAILGAPRPELELFAPARLLEAS